MAEQEQQQGGGGSFWTRKLGPLPFWAYALILLAAVGAWRLYSEHKAAASTQQDTSAAAMANAQPPVVFQDYPTTLTYVNVPPGGGREHPPTNTPPPVPAPPPVTVPPGEIPVPIPAPAPAPAPAPSPAPTQPAGNWVTVSKFTSKNPPWNSTISGIAAHYGYGNNWGTVWNNPANAALKARRKQPNLIQPNDRVFVPAK